MLLLASLIVLLAFLMFEVPRFVPGVLAVAGIPTIVVDVPYVPGDPHSVPGAPAIAGVPTVVVGVPYVPGAPILFQAPLPLLACCCRYP